MSIPHLGIGRKSIFPSQRTSKQAYQTRPVPEKRERDQHRSQDTKPLNPHNSTHPFEEQTRSPSVPPFCPPKETSPRFLGDPPARLFPNGVLYASSHSADSSDRF